MNHFFLISFNFWAGVQSIVFVEPDSAESLFVDWDHGVRNFESSEAIKEALKAHYALLEHIERLSEIHLEDMVQFEGAVLVVNFNFDDILRIQSVPLDCDVFRFDDGKLSVVSPFVGL